jgi:hypothetical protein
VDGVLDAIRPVLDIPPTERISWHRRRLARISDMLCAGHVRDSPIARTVREEIAAFNGASAGCAGR